jgi:predicted nucleic acid-binding protein
MSEAKTFFDTNVLLYLFSADARKSAQAEALLAEGGAISVQVLNEFVAVTRRKFEMPWSTVHEALAVFRAVLSVEPLTLEVHQKAVEIAEANRLNIYDAQILAAALAAKCAVVFSEDMQDGWRVADVLTVRNPFTA